MTDEKLVRGMGRWDLTAVAINIIIGTGIFLLPARVTGLIGTYSLFAFLACAIIVGLIVLCFAEVSSRFESTGGMYLYAREAFGPVVGFEVGWLYWIVRVAGTAANCNALLIYLEFFFPAANTGAVRVAIISIVIAGLTVVNILGVRESAILTNVFTVGKIVPLLVFVAVGLFFIQPSNFTFGEVPTLPKFSEAILVLIYAYVGFEAAVIPAGETKDPKRSLPFALLTALAFCTLLFILIQIVTVGTLSGLADSKRPLADAAGQFLGSFGATFIAIGALISILGNLNGGFLATTRLPFAMAEQRELPRAIAKTHDRFRTPYVSIVLTAIVILILTIQSSFLSAVTISVVVRLIVYATTCISLPVFRYWKKDVPDAAFKTPYGLVVAVLSLVLIGWLLTDKQVLDQALSIGIAAFLGLVIYGAYRLLGKDPK